MTSILESGEILPLHPAFVDTSVFDVGESTRNLAPYTHGMRPAYRRPGATGEQPLYQPQTIGVVDHDLPPVPGDAPAGPEQVRPDGYRSRHRAPRPVWAYLVTGAGLGSV